MACVDTWSSFRGWIGEGERRRSAAVDAFKEADEGLDLGRGERAEAGVVEPVEGRVEAREELASGSRDPAVDAATVLGGPLALHELLLLEPVEEARDAGRALDHALRDVERGEPGLPCAAQDAQHVVLLH